VHEGAIEELRRIRSNVVDAYLQVERDLAEFTGQAARASARVVELDAQAASLEKRCAARQAALEELDREEDRRRAASRVAFEEEESLRRMAEEARREVESEVEELLGRLADTKTAHEAARGGLAETERRRAEFIEDTARLEEELRVLSGRRQAMGAEVNALDERLTATEARLREREDLLGHLRVDESELRARNEALVAEMTRLTADRDSSETFLRELNVRIRGLEAEMVAMEKERAGRARADLKDLRELLRAREIREKEHLDRLNAEARAEFQQLQEDWVNEEKGGSTSDELRRLRGEVEDRRRDLAKAERQLSAMRAGLSKLREENGRLLLRRVQAFEGQQLEDLRRRINESKTEIEALEREWGSEMRSAELVDRQWMEIRQTVDRAEG
jgi:chromosome segregation protein